ncbi:MAG: alpha-N-arabinofuranosidase [Ruminococcaceae bacterium]|nr:alpha-N-arabinofuranosidase [Oscillospiraceae bacterium]
MSQAREPIVTHVFTADPSAHVFDGRLYVYPSHDLPHDGKNSEEGGQYIMEDYHVFSMTRPGEDVMDHGEALHVRDVPWAERMMWAPDAACKNGKYYLYFPAKDADGIFRIGVAVSDSPTGPFTPDAAPIPESCSIDPAVFTDDDGRSYLYFGGIWGGQLDRWVDGVYDPSRKTPVGDEIAVTPLFAELSDDMHSFRAAPVHVVIQDENGEPIRVCDEERRFFEGSWMNKIGDTYYLSYSTGTTHYVAYATSDKPQGPFTYRGIILKPVVGWTTQHSIVEFEGKWYLFYHDCEFSGGIDHRRTVKWTELTIHEDGSIETLDVRH